MKMSHLFKNLETEEFIDEFKNIQILPYIPKVKQPEDLSIEKWEEIHREGLNMLLDLIEERLSNLLRDEDFTIDYNDFVIFCYEHSYKSKIYSKN